MLVEIKLCDGIKNDRWFRKLKKKYGITCEAIILSIDQSKIKVRDMEELDNKFEVNILSY